MGGHPKPLDGTIRVVRFPLTTEALVAMKHQSVGP